MRRFVVATIIAILSPAHAEDGVFDRSAEVEGYIRIINTGTRAALIDVAHDIAHANLGDPKVARALRDKLASDVPSLDLKSSVDNKYRKSMVLALAATGAVEYEADVRSACDVMRAPKRDVYCDKAADAMARNKERNEVMASTKYHRSGDDPKVSRMMNLIMSDDFRFKEEAAREMSFAKMFDPRLLDAMDIQVQHYASQLTWRSSRDEVNTVGYFVKLLGYSGNEKYRNTIVSVANSHANTQAKKHARTALHRLDATVPGSSSKDVSLDD